MKRLRILFLLALAWCVAPQARAELLAFELTDPVGDSTSDVDVVAMVVLFDNATGAYEIVVLAAESAPFAGAFRLNLHLFNPDAPTTDCLDSFLSDGGNDFDLEVPSREVVVTGASNVLLGWEAGDRVATNGVPFGTPDCSLGFTSAVTDLPWGPPFAGDSIADGDVHAVIYVPPFFSDGFESGDTSAWAP